MALQPAVLWDMDGVLVDTTQIHYQAWNQVLEPYHISFNFDRFIASFGMNNQAVITDLFGSPTDEFIEHLANKKEMTFRALVPGNVVLLPGVGKWLKRFQDWGFPQAIVSSAPSENVDTIVDAMNIRGYFKALVSATGLPSKPHPAIFLKAARLVGVPPKDCLVVEDAPQGVQGARRAGMKSLAVLTTRSAEELKEASLIVQDLSCFTVEMAQELLQVP